MLYTLNIVASLQRKIIHGRPYYYLVESRRVNGRPRPVVVQYLGSADTLLQRLQQPQAEPTRARLSQFGGVAALYDLAQQLRLVELIDEHASKRHQGPSLGQYMLVAAINRCLAPTSKLQMPAWLRSTPLLRWLGLSAAQFSAPRFWDNMELLGKKQIAAISEALAQRLIATCQLDVNSLVFDCTNFDTFIDTENHSRRPQRGHAKSKRTDLRIVGLALLVSVDFHVPLLWKVYPGNQHDSITFAQALQELTQRYQVLARHCRSITLIFDKGNNSATNQEILDASHFHFVGSLVPTHFADLLALPVEKFQELEDARLKPTRAWRVTRQVWGQERTLVITFSPELQRKQIRGIEQHLSKKRRALEELQAKLRRSQKPGAKGKGYSRESLTKRVRQICSGQHISKILQSAFADMKDPHFLSWEPMFHWTDSKIRVHAFYCVLALILGSLLQRRAAQNGLSLSLQALFKALNGIQEVTNVFPPAGKPGSPGRPHVKTTLTEMDDTQQALFRLLALDRHRHT